MWCEQKTTSVKGDPQEVKATSIIGTLRKPNYEQHSDKFSLIHTRLMTIFALTWGRLPPLMGPDTSWKHRGV